MQKFLAFALWLLAGLAIVFNLAVLAFPLHALGFTSSSRLLADGSQAAAVGGIVADLPAPGLFYLTDRTTPLAVQYAGELPEFVQKQATVVVSGSLRRDGKKALLQADSLRPMSSFQKFSYMGGYGLYVWISYALALLLLAVNFSNPLRRELALRQSLAPQVRGQGVRP